MNLQKDYIEIPEYHSYLINKSGKIYSRKTNSFLKPFKDHRGYYSVNLINNKGVMFFRIHKLLISSFYPELNVSRIYYKDKNKENLCLENLKVFEKSIKPITKFKKQKTVKIKDLFNNQVISEELYKKFLDEYFDKGFTSVGNYLKYRMLQ